MGVALCALIVLLSPYQTHPVLSSSIFGFTVIKWVGLMALVVSMPAYLRQGADETQRSRKGVGKLWLLFLLSTASSIYWYAGGMSQTYLSCISLFIFGIVMFAVVDRYSNVVVLTYCAVTAMFVSTLYIFKEVILLRLEHGVFVRPYGGTFDDPNYYALSGVIVLPLSYYLYARGSSGLKRHIAFGMGVVILAGTLLTLSRGGVLGLISLMVSGYVLSRRKRKALVAIIAVASFVAALAPTALMDRIRNTRLSRAPEESVGDVASTTRRFDLYRAGLRMMVSHPVLGVGLGRFKDESLAFAPELGFPGVAHSMVVEVGAELGLVGLLLLVLVEADCLRKAMAIRRASGRHADLRLLSESLIASLVGFFVSGTFISGQYTKLHWYTVFAVIILFNRCVTGDAAMFLRASIEDRNASSGVGDALRHG